MRQTVVLGAGLTGLSAAYHMAKSGQQVVVIEREAEVGGACRTLTEDGFSFDLTGHLLHLRRDDSTPLLAELGVLRELRRHRRRAGVALAGRITPYPLQIHTYRLPAEVRRDCVLGFVQAALAGRHVESAGEDFATWVLGHFGEGFARHFFFPYNSKLYCCPPSELTAEWAGRFVPRPSLADVIDGAFGLFRTPVGYNATFLYPRHGGIALLANALASRLATVRRGVAVRRIELAQRTLELESGERLGWKTLIATVPLPHLVAMTADLPEELRGIASRLRAVAVANLNLGVRGAALRREHWLYVPEERFPFYRVGFPSNHGDLAPAGHHTVSVEITIPAGTALPAEAEELCLEGLEALGLLSSRRDIVTRSWARIDPAYVVFDGARHAALGSLRDAYQDADVVLAGRWAEWKYSTMEDALWDGATVARRLAP